MKQHKFNIHKNPEGDVHLVGKPKAHRLLLPWNSTRRHKLPLGRIELDICFGNSSNYCREKLEFEVMDWPS
jgi:hypothetical protein